MNCVAFALFVPAFRNGFVVEIVSFILNLYIVGMFVVSSLLHHAFTIISYRIYTFPFEFTWFIDDDHGRELQQI